MLKQKKLWLVCLLVLIIFAGCSKNTEEEAIIYSEDLAVTFVYHDNTSNQRINFVLENTGEKKISAATIIIASYDTTGQLMNTSNPIRKIELKDANLEAGTSNIYQVADTGIEDSKYYRALVFDITYGDATVWSFESIDLWQKQLESTLDVDSENSKINAKITAGSETAATNSYIEIVSLSQTTFKEDLPNRGIEMELKNISDQNISSVSLIVAMYDADNQPIGVPENQQILALNVKKIPYTNVIEAGQSSGSLSADDFFVENTKQYKYIVYEVIFEDGSTWKNVDAVYWVSDVSHLFQ